jgi:hypothetical protein
MHVMLAHWIPPLERSKFSSYVYSGKLSLIDTAESGRQMAVYLLLYTFLSFLLLHLYAVLSLYLQIQADV